jgi:hypothetical protein
MFVRGCRPPPWDTHPRRAGWDQRAGLSSGRSLIAPSDASPCTRTNRCRKPRIKANQPRLGSPPRLVVVPIVHWLTRLLGVRCRQWSPHSTPPTHPAHPPRPPTHTCTGSNTAPVPLSSTCAETQHEMARLDAGVAGGVCVPVRLCLFLSACLVCSSVRRTLSVCVSVCLPVCLSVSVCVLKHTTTSQPRALFAYRDVAEGSSGVTGSPICLWTGRDAVDANARAKPLTTRAGDSKTHCHANDMGSVPAIPDGERARQTRRATVTGHACRRLEGPGLVARRRDSDACVCARLDSTKREMLDYMQVFCHRPLSQRSWLTT